MGLSALFVAPYTIASLYINTAWSGDMLVRPLMKAVGRPAPVQSPESLVGLSIFAVIAGLLLGPLVYSALVRVADQVWRGEPPAIGAALAWSLRRLFALLVTGFLALLAGALLSMVAGFVSTMVVGVGVLALGGARGGPPSAAAMVWMFVVVLGLVVLYAGVWCSFLFVPQVIVVENRGYFGAIGRSCALVWPRVFRTVAVFWSTVLLTLSLSLVVLLPQLLWDTAVGQTGAGLVGRLAQGAVMLLIFPLLPLVTTVAYHDHRLRHEGLDLEERLRRLEGEAGHA